MKFSLAKGPFLRSKRSTTGIMLELFAVLSVVWIAAVVAYSIRFDFLVGLRAIFVVLTSLVTTLAIDVIVALMKGKRNFKEIGKFVLTSYSYVTAIIFALCLPVGVSYYVVVIGSIVATLLGKYVFGGFGYNIFNPAIIGRIFVGLAFGSSLNYGIVGNVDSSYDFVSGATVTGSSDWRIGYIPTGYNWKDLLFGNYNGAMGETFTVLLVIAAIYLIVRGIVNYRLIFSYLITIIGISFFVGLLYSPGNVLSYTLLQLITGGIMFGAVFMITDPVTSPKSMNGKIIFGIGAAALTMFIRINSDYPEGVMFSIALMNMLNPLIDSCIKGTTFNKLGSKWTIVGAFFIGSILLNVGFNAMYPINDGQEHIFHEMFGKSANVVNISDTLDDDDKVLGINEVFKIKNNDDTYYVYNISVKDPIGEETTSFVLGIDSQGKIAKLTFTQYGDSWAEKYNEKYIDKVTGKDKVGTGDSISGATATGSVIRKSINGAIAHFGGVN
jgi:Na+-translocating ferredoxin:NAD+ oxidoreductase RnfD subunit